MKRLGKDLSYELASKIVYERCDSNYNQENRLDGIATFKVSFNSVSDFLGFVGKDWQGSQAEHKWIADQIYQKDSNVQKDKPVILEYIRYKDSILEEAPVVVIVSKYSQD